MTELLPRLPNRALISLAGPDAIALLERTVTHSVSAWQEGEWRYGGLLTPQGKVIADYLACHVETGLILLDMVAEAADDLEKRLKLFRLRSAVDIRRETSLALVLDADGHDPRSDALPGRRLVDPSEAGEPTEDWDARAIAAGVPEWGRDYGMADVFPSDVNMDRMGGVDYRKGCFVGQEVVSRMYRRGKIRKRTLVIEGAGLAAGDEVRGESGPAIGQVTSAAGGLALAQLRIDRLAASEELGQALSVGESAVAVRRTDWLDEEIAALAEASST